MFTLRGQLTAKPIRVKPGLPQERKFDQSARRWQEKTWTVGPTPDGLLPATRALPGADKPWAITPDRAGYVHRITEKRVMPVDGETATNAQTFDEPFGDLRGV